MKVAPVRHGWQGHGRRNYWRRQALNLHAHCLRHEALHVELSEGGQFLFCLGNVQFAGHAEPLVSGFLAQVELRVLFLHAGNVEEDATDALVALAAGDYSGLGAASAVAEHGQVFQLFLDELGILLVALAQVQLEFFALDPVGVLLMLDGGEVALAVAVHTVHASVRYHRAGVALEQGGRREGLFLPCSESDGILDHNLERLEFVLELALQLALVLVHGLGVRRTGLLRGWLFGCFLGADNQLAGNSSEVFDLRLFDCGLEVDVPIAILAVEHLLFESVLRESNLSPVKTEAVVRGELGQLYLAPGELLAIQNYKVID